jgi:alpha-tubulin suppressor-like RCC1 family protein
LEKIGAKNAINIFCGKNHSFYIDNKNYVYAFG